MKKLIVALCCFFVLKAATAQQIIKLDIDSTTLTNKLVIPNLDNLEKLLNASRKDFAATMISLGYELSKEDTDIYVPKTLDDSPVFGVMKGDQVVSVVFYQAGNYPQQMKDAFVSQYQNLEHARLKGTDDYTFQDKDGNGKVKFFSMIFDTRKKGGGFVMLLTGDQ